MITAVRRCDGDVGGSLRTGSACESVSVDGAAQSCDVGGAPCMRPHHAVMRALACPVAACAGRDEIDYDPFSDEGVYCRARTWLLAAYAVSFGAVFGSVMVMLHRYGLEDAGACTGVDRVYGTPCSSSGDGMFW